MGLGQSKHDTSLKYLLLQKAMKLLSLDIFSNTEDLVRIINHNILNGTQKIMCFHNRHIKFMNRL